MFTGITREDANTDFIVQCRSQIILPTHDDKPSSPGYSKANIKVKRYGGESSNTLLPKIPAVAEFTLHSVVVLHRYPLISRAISRYQDVHHALGVSCTAMSRSASCDRRLVLYGFDYEVINSCIDYIYYGTITETKLNSGAHQLIQLANQLQFDDLKAECELHLAKQLHAKCKLGFAQGKGVDSCLEFFDIAIYNNAVILQMACEVECCSKTTVGYSVTNFTLEQLAWVISREDCGFVTFKAACEDELAKRIDANNVCEMLAFAAQFMCVGALQASFEFLCNFQNTSPVQRNKIAHILSTSSASKRLFDCTKLRELLTSDAENFSIAAEQCRAKLAEILGGSYTSESSSNHGTSTASDLILPSSLNEDAKGPFLSVCYSKQGMMFRVQHLNEKRALACIEDDFFGEGFQSQHFSSIFSNNPIPPQCRLYYYETTVIDQGKNKLIVAGFGPLELCTRSLPGLVDNSMGYHGDDGRLYEKPGRLGKLAPRYGTGDTVGCGLDFERSKYFYTKNGELVAFGNLMSNDALPAYYPAIGIGSPDAIVDVNFGEFKEYQFSLQRYRKKFPVVSAMSTAEFLEHKTLLLSFFQT